MPGRKIPRVPRFRLQSALFLLAGAGGGLYMSGDASKNRNVAFLQHVRRLRKHHLRLLGAGIEPQFTDDPNRIEQCCIRVGGIICDFSKQLIDAAAMNELLSLAGTLDIGTAITALLDGAKVNTSEQRAALHPLLRAEQGERVQHLGIGAAEVLSAADAALRDLVQRLRDTKDLGKNGTGIDTLVNIGIGGSDFGPRLAAESLGDHELRVKFLSTPDENAWARLESELDPRRTMFVLVSKSFATPETLLNGGRTKHWLQQNLGDADVAQRLWAITAEPQAALDWGIGAQQLLAMPSEVGGRYCVWSSAGLAAAVAMGWDQFQAFRGGARLIDAHFRSTPLAQNLPVLLALLDFWHRVVGEADSRVVAIYDIRLRQLVPYLQQLEMESNGKCVSRDGREPVQYSAAAVLGGLGPDCQHTFFQALHQGVTSIPVDFIGVIRSGTGVSGSRRHLLANLLAQSAALMRGYQSWDPEKSCPGNRSSSTILLDELTPATLGQLLALYEHKVYVLGHLLNINPFDQFGVELGKRLAESIEPLLAGTSEAHAPDPSTARLLAEIHTATAHKEGH